ncbi:2-dehydro-3-deoxy-6-phosphogalactonate aldolase [Aestuariivirga sp.]|uniref:2-dehydro-3-deoxy-6-phosphogalactonate aldolase n=1 Tax=Aestuariivirga sp. TaxID=2650926 RepID=UPI0039E5C950
MTFDNAAKACGLVAILRRITPDEVIAVTEALYQAGLRIVEVPLNSPDPFISISRIAKAFSGRMICGAGTVLDRDDVQRVKDAGGEICVSPDCNPLVIARAVNAGLEALPGVFTPTEAFSAIRAGARNLKLFPAEAASPVTVKAWRAVLPKHVQVFAVGGITPANMQGWIDAGCAGFGIGSNIYKPGMTADDVEKSAKAFMAGWKNLKGMGA